MSQWLVTQGSNQFTVDGLSELKRMAESGQLKAGDMIQPPGAGDWIYAVEVPGLEDLLNRDDDDDDEVASGSSTKVLGAVFVLVAVVFGAAMTYYSQQLPTGAEVLIGEGGLTYSEMIVTEPGQKLLADADPRAGSAASLRKDEILELLAKRGDFYKARTKGGAEGWISQGAVIPMYQLGGEDVREEFDPLYNPDRYVDVANASWLPLPDQEEEGGTITVFQFFLHNTSKYLMTDLVLEAIIKDAKGSEVERVEVRVEGFIPPMSGSMVGTLRPEDDDEDGEPRLLTTTTFREMIKNDPELQLRYSEGVEVMMDTDKFTNATINIIELRAVPDDQAAAVVSSHSN